MDNTQIARPPVYVAREDVQALRALNFSWTKIARVLGVSQQSLYRRLNSLMTKLFQKKLQAKKKSQDPFVRFKPAISGIKAKCLANLAITLYYKKITSFYNQFVNKLLAAILTSKDVYSRQRVKEYNIPSSDWSAISTVDLDHLFWEIKDNHPNAGEVIMNGHLVALGIRVPHSQLRESIHCVDRYGTELRQLHTVKHHQYSVESPNAVWHIDGHHKLIRWRFVVHAAMDGFSRIIPYIECADNNHASTALEVFCNGVTRFGLPERVRSDHGGENIHVWRYIMLDTHNGDHQCVIAGCSTNNERVERLWQDVHCSLSHFQDTFRDLESGVLDLLNEMDMFSPHYIFLPMINKCLQDFQESWNNHTLPRLKFESPTF